MPAGAIYVGRPTQWGNPFRPYVRVSLPASELGIDQVQAVSIVAGGVEECIALYRVWLYHWTCCWRWRTATADRGQVRVSVPPMPPLPINVRPASPSELESMLVIERASFHDPWSLSEFRNAAKHAQFLVASHAGEIVGFTILHPAPPVLEIWDIAVAPQHRRRNVGRQLVAAARRRLGHDGLKVLRIDIRDTEQPAHLFFAELGFRLAGNTAECSETAFRYEYRPGGEIGVAVLKSILEGDGRTILCT
jgi:ribosomal-protein-alanine N-acetyltransferase